MQGFTLIIFFAVNVILDLKFPVVGFFRINDADIRGCSPSRPIAASKSSRTHIDEAG